MDHAVVVPPASRKPVTIKTGWYSEAFLATDPKDEWKYCFDAAKLMTLDFEGIPDGVKLTLDDRYDRILVTRGLPSLDGRTSSDPKRAAEARAYIDQMLDKGLRVLVGVVWMTRYAYEDPPKKMTEHFLTVYGRDYDADGRVYYKFKDPGTKLPEFGDGQLFVDGDTGKLFRTGSNPAQRVAPASNYEVTEVRTYPQFPPAGHRH